MAANLFKPWRKSRPRSISIGLALASYLIVAVGVPLPAVTTQADSGKPFPCRGRSCGCSPDGCAKRCCCSKHAPAPVDSTEPADTTEANAAAPRFQWGSSINALKCRGLTTFWVSAGSLPPPAPSTWLIHPAPTAWLAPSTFPPRSGLVPPPTPPPRSLV